MPVYVKGGTDGRIIVQELTSTVTPFTGVEFAQDIVTSGVEGFRRLQVDVAETGFFEGREFRTVRKIRLATGETKVYKFTCLNDFILFSLIFTVSAGNYEVHIWDGANLEETVLSTDPVPIYLKNYSGEFRLYDGDRYQSQTTITTGGSIAVNDPEQYLDYVEMITANATAQRATVGQSTGSKRYLPGSAVFFVEIFAINGPVRGTISSDWEERPPGVK
ncbi:MAG: hypothetical protein R3230_00080 [Nitrosopumilaceae archaeon]|nr:hypothetical protein [Nitrosopumilaceae archaeon]